MLLLVKMASVEGQRGHKEVHPLADDGGLETRWMQQANLDKGGRVAGLVPAEAAGLS